MFIKGSGMREKIWEVVFTISLVIITSLCLLTMHPDPTSLRADVDENIALVEK